MNLNVAARKVSNAMRAEKCVVRKYSVFSVNHVNVLCAREQNLGAYDTVCRKVVPLWLSTNSAVSSMLTQVQASLIHVKGVFSFCA